jgi:hypothetical protein
MKTRDIFFKNKDIHKYTWSARGNRSIIVCVSSPPPPLSLSLSVYIHTTPKEQNSGVRAVPPRCPLLDNGLVNTFLWQQIHNSRGTIGSNVCYAVCAMGHEAHRAQNQEWLCWQGPAAVYPTGLLSLVG